MTQISWGGKWVHLAYIWIVSHLSAKNYQNRWKFNEVLTKTNLLSFLGDTVYFRECKFLKWVLWPWPRLFQGRFVIGRQRLTLFVCRWSQGRWVNHSPTLEKPLTYYSRIILGGGWQSYDGIMYSIACVRKTIKTVTVIQLWWWQYKAKSNTIIQKLPSVSLCYWPH